MKKIILLLAVAVMVPMSSAFAQGFTAALYNFSDMLTEQCAGGDPLTDQYTVKIYWDTDNNGPDDDDPQPVVGGGINEVNYNQFPMSGEFGDGFFGGAGVDGFTCAQNIPSPAKYYLRVCLDGTEHWRSDTFSVQAGYQDIYFGTGFEALNCISAACPGCQSPAAVQNFNADTSCSVIHLTWNTYTDGNADSLEIKRDGVVIAMLGTTATSYNDNSAPGGDLTYSIRARRNCGGGNFGYSNPATDVGRRIPTMGLAVMDSASNTLCDSVRVWFDNPSNMAGIDSFRVKRGATVVARLVPGLAGAQRIITIFTPEAGSAAYTVVPWSAACGEGTASAADQGEALHTPAQVVGVSASDNTCNVVSIIWNDVAGETSYQILRNGAQIGTNSANDTTFDDGSGAAGTVFQYSVRAVNGCGTGTVSITDNGSRITTPLAPTSVVATDSSDCGRVLITWTDNATTETGYKVVRNSTDTLATLPASSNSYADSTAVPGTNYAYTVFAFNACGNSGTGSNAGSRKAPPIAPTTTTATDAQINFVTVTWSNVPNETRFGVLRNGVLLAAGDSLAPNILSFNDSTAAPGLRYLYQVRGFNECGDGAISVGDSGGVPGSAPTPTGLVASDTLCTHVAVSWTDVTGETGYRVYRDGIALSPDNAAGDVTFDDNTAVAGTTYSYTVRALNGAIESAPSNADNGRRVPAPAAPVLTLPVVLDIDCDTVCFAWTAVADAQSYVLLKDGVRVDSTNGTTICHVPGDDAAHDYNLRAKNSCGESGNSNTVNAATLPAPSAPTNPIAVSNDCETVDLTWDDPLNADSIRIYRDDVLIATVPAGVELYSDAAGSGDHTYHLIALNECGVSPASVDEDVTVNFSPGPPLNLTASDTSCQAIYLEWDQGANAVDGEYIYRDGILIDSIFGGIFEYTDMTAASGDHDYYVVSRGGGDCPDSAPSDTVTGTRLPSTGTPSGVTATDNRCDSIVVCWTSAAGTVDYYVVYEDGDSVGTTADTCFTYAPATGTYSYTVKAFSAACGFGAASAADNGTRLASPGVVTNLDASDNLCDGVMLTWSPGSGTITGYEVRREGNLIATTAPNDTFYFDNGAAVGGNNYTVTSISSSVNCPPSDPVAISGTVLEYATAATDFVASDTSCVAVYMTWTASGGAFTGYEIYENDIAIAQVPSSQTNYTHSAATPGEVNEYYVKTLETCGHLVTSEIDTGTRILGPDAPTNVTASDDHCDDITITWSAATGDVGSYNVYDDDGLVASVPSTDTVYVDAGAAAGVIVNYHVTAVSAFCGETLPSTSTEGFRLPQMPQVQGLTASTDQCAGVVLNWNDVAGADLYYIYRDGGVNPYDSVEVVLVTATYTDTNTVFGEDHDYHVSAVNPCGEGEHSAMATGSRAALPAQVQNVVATDTVCGEVCVTWTDLSGESSYIIYREGTPIDTVPANTTQYCDTTAEIGAWYMYSVSALNGCGEGEQSAQDNGMAIISLDPVDDLTASTTECDGVDLSWADLIGETGYRIYRQGVFLIDLPADQTMYTDNTIEAGTCRIYRVHGFNECGEGPLGNQPDGCRRAVPSAAATLQATSTICTHVQLNWSGINDADSIRIFRNDVLIRTVDGDTGQYNDSTATAGVQYLYSVQGFNPCGSAPESFDAAGARANVPGVVQNLAASSDQCFQITVTWTDLIVEAGYYIYRDENPVPIDTLAMNTTTFVDSPRVGAYHYYVRGFNDCGIGDLPTAAFGNGLTVPSTVANVAASVNCATVHVTWGTLGGILGYRLYRNPGNTLVTTINNPNDGDFDDTPGVGTWTYYVIAFNACGDAASSSESAPVVVAPSLPQVTGLTASVDSCECSYLRWNSVAGATGYRIYCDGNLIQTNGADTTYTDCSPQDQCLYTVAAINACGAGPQSAQVLGIKLRAPATVTGFDATDTLCTQVNLIWNADANVDYWIISEIDGGFPPVQVNAPVTFPYAHIPVCGSWTYIITAWNECGPSNPGPSANGTRLCPPGGVQNVQASDASCASVVISWNNQTNVDSFHVLREGTQIGVVNGSTFTFTDNTAPAGTYTYCVWAENRCDSTGLTCDDGTRLAAPSVPTNVQVQDSCGGIIVTWTASTGDVDNYQIRRDGAGAPITVPATPQRYVDTTPGSHFYEVRAVSNECGNSNYSAASPTGTNHVVPPPPTGVTASDTGCAVIHIEWNQGVTDGFSIYRDGVYIGHRDDDEPSFDDATVTDNDNHTYTIRALSSPVCDDSSAFSAGATGRLVDLFTINEDLPDTVYCDSTYQVDVTLCGGIDSIVVALSLDGGAYQPYLTIPNPTEFESFTAPAPDDDEHPNSRFRVISHRGVRRDTVITTPFLLDCNGLAADDHGVAVPEEFYLAQNYPNPFNPSTTIEFGVPRLSYVSVEIYDVSGRLVANPLSGLVEPGVRMITWDCSECATGMYILRLVTEERVLQRKMLLMK